MEEEQVDKAGKEVLKERVDDMLEKTADQIDQSTQIIFHKKTGASQNKMDGRATKRTSISCVRTLPIRRRRSWAGETD